MFKLLLDEPPLVILPSLAVRIGLPEAIVLQQVHYWLQTARETRREGHFWDDHWWIYNTYEEWQKTFPFWSERTIQRTILNLEGTGLLLSSQPRKGRLDRRKWYSIDYEHYRDAVEPETASGTPKSTSPAAVSSAETPLSTKMPDWHSRRRQNGTFEDDKMAPSNAPDWHARRRQNGTLNIGTETSEAETTAETAAAEKTARDRPGRADRSVDASAAAVGRGGNSKKAIGDTPGPLSTNRGLEEREPEDEEATLRFEALVARLVAESVNRSDARRLAASQPEECLRQLEYLAFVANFKTSRGAYLRSAIEQGFAAPAGYVAAERSRQRQARRDQARREEQAQNIGEEARRERLRELRDRVERDEPERWAALVGRAEALLPTLVRNRPNGPAYRASLHVQIDALLREELDSVPPETAPQSEASS